MAMMMCSRQCRCFQNGDWEALHICQALVFAEDDDTTAVLKFLRQYHYISPTSSGNHDVETAVKRFQEFAGLNVTGVLDKATIAQTKKSRCGMPDVDEGGRVKRYATGSKWIKKHLTYFVEYGADLSQSIQDDVFAKALNYWADVSGLSFAKAASASAADLKISFGSQTHSGSAENTCSYPFDGPSGVLAHAFFPSDGRAHFDEDETFTDGTSSGINLLWVATHEFGHALGIAHSEVQNAVMYPYYTGYVPNFSLQQDDIDAIQFLYGQPDNGEEPEPRKLP
ncbi:hypothetical protein ACROYT_G011125 [Oculina patagonica]